MGAYILRILEDCTGNFPKKLHCCSPPYGREMIYTVVTRINSNVLTSMGLDPEYYYTIHKDCIKKEIYIVMTAYVLNGNDITAGEKAILIAHVTVYRIKMAT